MANKLTAEEFIIKARSVHGDKYDYSKSKYIYARENIEIICNKHKDIKEAGYNLITIWESDWKTQCVTTDQS